MHNKSQASVSENQLPPHNRAGWKSVLILTIAVMAGAMLVGLLVLQIRQQNQPHTVAPGIIVDSFGEYQTLTGQTRFVISPHEDPSKREIVAAAESVGRKYPIGVVFDADADWFAAFDESDRVWLYTSSDGVRCWHKSEGIISGISQVGDANWQGIPKSFLEKLPQKNRAVYNTWMRKQGLLPRE